MNGRIADDEVSENDISFDPSDENDPVRVPDDGVVDNNVVVRARRAETDAKVTTLSCISVSTQPVRTDPVTACAARQSYAAAREAAVPVPDGSVPLKLVI